MSAGRERALEALERLGSFALGRAHTSAEASVQHWTDVIRAALRSSEPPGERLAVYIAPHVLEELRADIAKGRDRWASISGKRMYSDEFPATLIVTLPESAEP